jgi:hypothetical protein
MLYNTFPNTTQYHHFPSTDSATSDTAIKMHFSLATVILGFAALAAAAPSSPDGFTIVARQNGNRPVPQAVCCVANINIRQDKCSTANGQAGRCVPGGNNCKCERFSYWQSMY